MKFITLGFLHFIFQRNSALFLIILSNNIYFFNSLFANGIILIIIGFHLKLGFETLIEDYVHSKFLKLISSTLLHLILIYLFKGVYFFIITL
jgi:succinate dehydrogenase hydrophobic anchor subunit